MATKDVLFPGRGYRGDSMAERIKTDLRMPRVLLEWVEEICRGLGISKNAFFSIAGALLALRILPILPGTKRSGLFRSLKQFVYQVVEELEVRV